MLKAWLAALVAIGIMDAIWLGWLAKDFYRNALGPLMRPEVAVVPAALFYLAYPIGLIVLALQPVPDSWTQALLRSALVGLVAYGAYDLTNLATLQGFTARLAMVDIAWGAVVSVVGGAAAYAVLRSSA